MTSLATAGSVSFSSITVAISVFGAVIVLLAHVASIVWFVRGMQKDIRRHDDIHLQVASDLKDVSKYLVRLDEKVQSHDIELAVMKVKSQSEQG